MQISAITAPTASTLLTETFSSSTKGGSHGGGAHDAVVEQTASGYEAYVTAPPGPVVTGPSIELAEARLNSTVNLQA